MSLIDEINIEDTERKTKSEVGQRMAMSIGFTTAITILSFLLALGYFSFITYFIVVIFIGINVALIFYLQKYTKELGKNRVRLQGLSGSTRYKTDELIIDIHNNLTDATYTRTIIFVNDSENEDINKFELPMFGGEIITNQEELSMPTYDDIIKKYCIFKYINEDYSQRDICKIKEWTNIDRLSGPLRESYKELPLQNSTMHKFHYTVDTTLPLNTKLPKKKPGDSKYKHIQYAFDVMGSYLFSSEQGDYVSVRIHNPRDFLIVKIRCKNHEVLPKKLLADHRRKIIPHDHCSVWKVSFLSHPDKKETDRINDDKVVFNDNKDCVTWVIYKPKMYNIYTFWVTIK